jgi:dTDP-4-amino-4,6-dideoxygalactose transaminase
LLIPQGDLKREYDCLHREIDDAIARVLRRGWFILGEELEAFEAEWASYCGVDYAVGVGNGTDALHLALRAAGVVPGDEVVVPALTAAFTALAVSMAGATPVFADIDPARYTLDPAALEAAITPRTAAVVPVHLYGCPAAMAPIVAIGQRHGLLILEDAAQAHGARYGTARAGAVGDAAAFSFYPSKNLGAYGDAGAVTTNDASLAARIRLLRHGGQPTTYHHQILGVNSRLDEIQAAILRAKLPHLDAWNDRRRSLAASYETHLRDAADLVLPLAPTDCEHVYHQYVIRTPCRDSLRAHLSEAGVQSGVHYPRAVHEQPAFAAELAAQRRLLGDESGACPQARRTVDEILSLPMFPYLTNGEAEQVSRLVLSYVAK